ncbi:hypothetical protein [uncultured Dokdonia sp.]|uniref:hypothetical protein n=1 Tax=uncultured Dokdonia sp. TaxID=575653 RepID=UPI0026113206|nr:hypothetical protein [uncultured Dokdonia sp.]
MYKLDTLKELRLLILLITTTFICMGCSSQDYTYILTNNSSKKWILKEQEGPIQNKEIGIWGLNRAMIDPDIITILEFQSEDQMIKHSFCPSLEDYNKNTRCIHINGNWLIEKDQIELTVKLFENYKWVISSISKNELTIEILDKNDNVYIKETYNKMD